MNHRTLISAFMSMAAAMAYADVNGQNITKLQCEHLENPIGIDCTAPRFTWQLPDGVVAQSSYRIFVGKDSSAVASGKGGSWDSGNVNSEKVLAVYNGEQLAPFTKYWWKVTATDKDGRQYDSPAAHFETGVMNATWQGWWITDTKDLELRPAGEFRREFTVHGKVASARAYIACAGLFEMYINGEQVGDGRLETAFTRFDRRTLYLTKDITPFIHEGRNAVGMLLGNGWYNHQPVAVWDYEVAPWRHRPSFCMDLRITYEDGTVQTVISDRHWKTNLSEVTYNNIYVGEHVDFSKAVEGWSKPGFDDSKWNGVKLTVAPSGNITAQAMRPIRDVDTLRTVNLIKISDKDYIFDFGKNGSGVTEFRINGEKGTTFRLKHGEFMKNGHVSTENIDYFYHSDTLAEPFSTDIVTLAGGKEETFRPKFDYKGFRYVEVTSDRPVSLNDDNLTAYFVHSDVPVRGRINSSNDMLNKLWAASCRSYLSNLVGYPTDCPQREKNGWTGDATAAIDVGLYNFDPITVYEKCMNDHKDSQLPNGVYPNIVPSDGWGYDWGNGTDWTSSNIIIPWQIWVFYGDDRLISSMYDNMKAYISYIERTYPSGLTDWGLGDWIPVKTQSNLELTSSIYYHEDVRILAEIAALKGMTDDAEHYRSLEKKIRDQINQKYLDKDKGIYASGSQTEQAMPLFWNIVPEEYRQKVADNLADSVKAHGLDVGLLGSKSIIGALSNNGYLDLAYSLATTDANPSWGYWIKNGATTFYENWNITRIRDLSLNHIMYGEINAWFYKGLGGILPQESHPGFTEFIVKPGFAKGLDTFEATHDSPNGEIVSKWTRKGRNLIYTVRVPSNTKAHLILPDHTEDLTCGTYTFKVKAPK